MWWILFFVIIGLLIGRSEASPVMDNYCSVPVTMGRVVSPNILFVIDVSGSMGWAAYNPRANGRFWCLDSVDGCGHYDPNAVYEGYFIPDKVYIYDSGNGYWVEAPPGTSPASCPGSAFDTWFGWIIYVLDTSQAYTGSCLNFLLMSRIDLVRWAITGGMPSSCGGVNDNDCAPELFYKGVDNNNAACDTEGCILQTSFSGDMVKVPWSRIFDALVYRMKEMSVLPRFGVMFYSDVGVRDEKVYIGDFVSNNSIDTEFPYKNLIMHINGIDVWGGTPTAPALWDAYNYFAQNSPEYNGFQPQTGTGNEWKNPIYQCFDKNGDGSCQGSEFEKVPCAKNFVILMTDGQWNIGGDPNSVGLACTIDRGFESHSADPVVPAYWLHAKGMTNAITGDQISIESVYTIGLWLGGTGENSLKHVAIYGSFDTTANTWPGGTSGYPMDSGCWIDDCTIYGDGTADGDDKGSPCTPIPSSSPDWDEDGDGVPDTFYNAKNALEIKNSMERIILDILKRVSAGSGVASLSSKSDVSSVILQPYFYPFYLSPDSARVRWIGLLESFWFDIEGKFREDTVNPLKLDIDKDSDSFNEDRVFFIEYNEAIGPHALLVNMDPDASGQNQCQFIDRKNLYELSSVVDFACKLARTDATERNIYLNDGSNSLLNFDSSTATTVDLLHTIWSGIDSSVTSTDAQCIIDYLAGKDTNCVTPYAQRTRKFNIFGLCGVDEVNIWKLGDIINSAPAIVYYEPNNIYHKRYLDKSYREYIDSTTYRNRTAFAFVGANDGMLHVFRVGYIKENKYCTNDPSKSCRISKECGKGGFCVFDPNRPIELQNSVNDSGTNLVGREEWAFIPYNALPYLLWYGRKDYCHIHTVDYVFKIVDASINGPSNADKTSSSWRTLLIGVMGYGGQKLIVGDSNNNGMCDPGETDCKEFSSSVFVFDLTDWLDGNATEPTLLWEKPLPDATLTISSPVVIRRGGKDVNGDWYIVMGSGPVDPHAEEFVSDPKIYFIDLRTGNIVNQVSVPIPSNLAGAAVGNIRAFDMDNDYQEDILYFGVYGKEASGRQWGTLYRFHLIQNVGSYKAISSLSSTDISEVIALSEFCQTNYCPTVFAAPELAVDVSEQTGQERLWVIFGTGKMLNDDDKATKRNLYKNYLIALVDECWNPSASGCPKTYSKNDLKDTTNITVTVDLTSSQVKTEEVCSCGTVCDQTGDNCTSSCSLETVYVQVGNPTNYVNDVTTEGYAGWYIEYEGRVVMSTPVLVGDILDSLSYEPPGNICEGTGYTYLNILNYKAGTAPPIPSLITPEGVGVSGGTGEIKGGGGGIPLGPVPPPQGGKAMEIKSSKNPKRYEKIIQGIILEQQLIEGGKFTLWLER